MISRRTLLGHYAMHAVIIVAYGVSPLVAHAFSFQPFIRNDHGWYMLLCGLAVALVAYGPVTNACDQGKERFVRAYATYLSPLWALMSVAGLVGLWVFAFHEVYRTHAS